MTTETAPVEEQQLPKKSTKAGTTPDVLPEQWRVALHPEYPEVELSAYDVIYDAEFNYTRQVETFNQFDVTRERQGDTLEGKIGADTPLDFALGMPVLRFADDAEKARWLELHAQDPWFQAIPEAQRAGRIPRFIVVDGFGRCEEEWTLHGMAHPIKFRLLNTTDRMVSEWIAVIMNTTQRTPSYFDLAATWDRLMKHFGWNRTELARRMGVKKPQVTQILKCNKLPADVRAKAIKEGWPLLRVRQYFDRLEKVDVDKPYKPEEMKGKVRAQVKENINEYLEGPNALKLSKEAKAFLSGFLAALEFEDGDYQRKTKIEHILQDGGVDVSEAAFGPTEKPEKPTVDKSKKGMAIAVKD